MSQRSLRQRIGAVLRSNPVTGSFMLTLADTPRGKSSFVRQLPRGALILDVGCGNGSPSVVKTQRPDLFYVGLDISDYNQAGDPSDVADEYIIVPPDQFARRIENMPGRFDAVISSHNIEHCSEPLQVLRAMMASLKPGGQLYLSTPSVASVSFPHRPGLNTADSIWFSPTLNFFDDSTHIAPLDIQILLAGINAGGGQIEFASERHRPLALAIKGLVSEPYCSAKGVVMRDGSTWALYGFETVIWARKQSF